LVLAKDKVTQCQSTEENSAYSQLSSPSINLFTYLRIWTICRWSVMNVPTSVHHWCILTTSLREFVLNASRYSCVVRGALWP